MQLGFWIGKPYWNQGYCTEAARAVVKYGFEVLGLNRIFSRHFASNPASGRVLQKIGMRYEGTLREAYKKLDKYEDLVCYGLLIKEYHGFKKLLRCVLNRIDKLEFFCILWERGVS